MLFKNLKTGNFVATSDESSIELMQRSPIYEAVDVPAPAPVIEEKATPKAAKKPATGKAKPADTEE